MNMLTPAHLRRCVRSVCGGLVCAGALLAVGAEPPTNDRHDEMAGYLGQLPAYVEWPTNTLVKPGQPWRIGILGPDPFGEGLKKVLHDRQVAGRSFEIRHAAKLPDLPACDIIFIAGKDASEIKKILKQLGSRPVLTVSEHENFLALGGILQLQTRDAVRLLINLDHAHAARLKIPGKLLEVVSEVTENGRRRILKK